MCPQTSVSRCGVSEALGLSLDMSSVKRDMDSCDELLYLTDIDNNYSMVVELTSFVHGSN